MAGLLRAAANFVAPTTVLTGLLIYFGHVATAAEFGTFGISVATLELSTQELLLRSAGALYAPLGLLLAAVLCLAWAYRRSFDWLAAPARRAVVPRAVLILAALGVVLVGRGAAGIVVPEIARTEPIAMSPLSLGFGIAAVSYSVHLRRTTRGAGRRLGTPGWYSAARAVVCFALITLCLFWATSSFAAAYGRGRALETAAHLDRLPGVVVDTTERLYAAYTGVEETRLPPEEEQRYRYRYKGFRLLVESGGRLFLVPEAWRAEDGATVILRLDDDIRLQMFR